MLTTSAVLTDKQKILAEFFADKVKSVLGSVVAIIQNRKFNNEEITLAETIADVAFWDVAIVVWNEKRRWDAVRPGTAIKYLYGKRKLTAYGGPFKAGLFPCHLSNRLEWNQI